MTTKSRFIGEGWCHLVGLLLNEQTWRIRFLIRIDRLHLLIEQVTTRPALINGVADVTLGIETAPTVYRSNPVAVLSEEVDTTVALYCPKNLIERVKISRAVAAMNEAALMGSGWELRSVQGYYLDTHDGFTGILWRKPLKQLDLYYVAK